MIQRVLPLVVVFGTSWASAQDLSSELKDGDGLTVAPSQVPDAKKAQGLIQEPAAEVHDQNSATLDPKRLVEKTNQEIPEMASLREKSVYYAIASGQGLSVSSVHADRLDNDLQKVSAMYRKTGQPDANCVPIALSVKQRVKKDPDVALQVVDAELRANPGCSCEIVKAAILESDMKVETVLAIVKVAFEASPENMRLISQCAIAACPDALTAIQSLLAKYEKSTGRGDSAKSAKDADDGERAALLSGDEVAAIPNPLDFPGGPEGHNIIFNPPPVIVTPPRRITRVDP
jgi:hypothetical protein